MAHNHANVMTEPQHKKYLWIALSLTAIYLFAEVIGGLLTGSLALLSDAAHMLSDVSAIAISLTAVHLATLAANARKTFGYHRFEILAAAFNAILLFLVAIYIIYESYQRLNRPIEIQTMAMLLIATIGLGVNFISLNLLSHNKDSSLNIKSTYLEVWSDMLGSIGVIIGAIIIYFTKWQWVDSAIAIAIGLWILPRTWILLKETTNILLEGVPEGMDIEEIQKTMCTIPGIISVHDFHLWAVTSGKASLTAHIVYDYRNADPENLLALLKTTLGKKFSVYHTTLQFEKAPCQHPDDECNYILQA